MATGTSPSDIQSRIGATFTHEEPVHCGPALPFRARNVHAAHAAIDAAANEPATGKRKHDVGQQIPQRHAALEFLRRQHSELQDGVDRRPQSV